MAEPTTTTTTLDLYDVSHGCSHLCYTEGSPVLIAASLEKAKVGEAVLRPEVEIPDSLILYELPGGKRFEKHRVVWAGMLKDAWVRIK